MAKQTVQIVLQVSASGVQVVQGNLNALGNTANKTQNSLNSLKQLLGGLATAATIRQTVLLADSYARMLNRIRVVTNTNQELFAAMGAVERISRETRTSLEANVDMYARVALNVKQLGISQREIVRFSTSLNHALILSGVTAREAHWGMIQLSQGMASGALRGDELRSVMEQLPVVSDVLAKHLGVTRGELRLLAFQGKVTTQEIIAGFRAAEKELAEKFAKRIPTVDEAFTALRGSVTAWLGKMDQAVGGTRFLANALLFLGNHLDALTPIIAGFASIVGIGMLGSLLKVIKTIGLFLGVSNPWLIAIGLVAAGAVWLTQNWEDVLLTLAKLDDWLNNNFGVSLQKIGKAVDALVESLKKLAMGETPKIEMATPYAQYRHGQAKLEKMMRERGLTSIKGPLPAGMSTDWLDRAASPSGPQMSSEESARAWIAARRKAAAELSGETTAVPWAPSQAQQGIITGLQKAMESYTASIELYNNAIEGTDLTEMERLNLMNQIREAAVKNVDVLNQAYADGLFTEQEYTRASVQLSQERLKAATDAASGVTRGLNDVFLQMTDFASLTQQTVKDAFGGIEDAVVSLATTGKANLVVSVADAPSVRVTNTDTGKGASITFPEGLTATLVSWLKAEGDRAAARRVLDVPLEELCTLTVES